MTCYHATKPHSNGTAPTDILTYRYDGKLVYVPVAPNYVQALSHARDAFPQLKGKRDASLSLSLVAPGHGQKFVGISAPAWPKLVAHMARYQIIDVQVTRVQEPKPDSVISIPDITITYADGDGDGDVDVNGVEDTEPAPPYQRSEVVDDEKASYTRPRSTSASVLHPKRSWFFQKLHGQ